jgi:hypothetical protein
MWFRKKMPKNFYFLKKIIRNQKLIKQLILMSQITQYIIFSAVTESIGKKKSVSVLVLPKCKKRILQIELFQ